MTVSVTVESLGILLNDPTIQAERAQLMIDDALAACALFLKPVVLPDEAAWIVRRVAARGYVTGTSTRGAQQVAGGSPFGGGSAPMGAIWLSRADKSDLRQTVSGSNAFSINMLPSTYTAAGLPPWDVQSMDVTGSTS